MIPNDIIMNNKVLKRCFESKANHSFINDMGRINYFLLHRRLKHASDSKIITMCKNQTIKGLPMRFSQRFMTCGKDC